MYTEITKVLFIGHCSVQGEGWFGEDGLLLCQPDPLRKIHTRPMLLQYEGTEHIESRGVRVPYVCLFYSVAQQVYFSRVF